MLGPYLLIIHALDRVFERIDDLLFLCVALILLIQLSDDFPEVLLLLFNVDLVAFYVVMLLLFQFLVQLFVQSRYRVIELIVDLVDFVGFLHQLFVGYHGFVLFISPTTTKRDYV